MNEAFQAKGIVVTKIEKNEYDRIYVIFTKEYGKLCLFARSAAKFKGKLAAHLEPGSIARIYFTLQKNSNFYLLTGAVLLFKPKYLSYSFRKNKFIFQGLKILQKMTYYDTEETQNIEQTYELLSSYLIKLASCRNLKLSLLLQSGFVLKMLDLYGFRPDFKNCILCGVKIEKSKKIGYNKEGGGLECQKCLAHANSFYSLDVLKTAFFIMDNPFKKYSKIIIDLGSARRVWSLTLNHFQYCIS